MLIKGAPLYAFGHTVRPSLAFPCGRAPLLSAKGSRGSLQTEMERIGTDTLHFLFYNHPAKRRGAAFSVFAAAQASAAVMMAIL